MYIYIYVLCNYIYNHIIIYLIDIYICIHTHASCIKYNATVLNVGGRNGMNVHPATGHQAVRRMLLDQRSSGVKNLDLASGKLT